ncbi:hypothetical protein NHX12_007390 [Muraenolepis orangiensis]|uniref:Uncharacterized protein n=1 Tax=Muraenolepis orangiensis TaxID=630683 RepID=A0A9Q0DTB8_9TELE|nr:hypothetical protein NHX12_007390 [Muraenolepis orangiensis]
MKEIFEEDQDYAEHYFHPGRRRWWTATDAWSFNVSGQMLCVFYQGICKGRSISTNDSNKLNKVVKKAGTALGSCTNPKPALEPLVDRRMC